MGKMAWRSALIDMFEEFMELQDYRIGPPEHLQTLLTALRDLKTREDILAMPEAQTEWHAAEWLRENL